MLGASILASWGTILETVGAAGRTCEGSGVEIRLMLWRFGTPFWKLFGHRGLNFCLFFWLVSRSFFWPIHVSKSGCLGTLKQGFRFESIAKNSLSQEFNSGDIRLHFFCFFGLLFMTFGAIGSRLIFGGFSGLPGRTPELRQCTSGRVTIVLWGLEKRCLNQQGCRTMIQRYPSQPGGTP